MKKSLISFAIAAVALLAPAAMMAQTNTEKAKTENRQGNKKNGRGETRPQYNPFEGLNLTDAQQAKLKDLGCPDGRQCKAGEKKDQKGEKKGQNGQQTRPSREEMAKKKLDARKDYLAKVKQILTPEQYLQFLENNFTNRPGKAGHMDRHHKDSRKHHKGDHMKGHKGQQGRKGQKPGNGNNAPAANL